MNEYRLARLVLFALMVTGLVVVVSFDDLLHVIVGSALLLTAALVLAFWPELSKE